MMSETKLHVSITEELDKNNNRWFLENLVRILATGEETEGRFFLGEVYAAPGDEPPLHLHENEEEGLYIIEGQMTVWAGEEAPRVLNAGEFVLLPRGIAHTYKVTSPTETRYLAITTPAGFEGFVRGISVPAEKLTLPQELPEPTPEQMQAMQEVAKQHGIQLLGPPGARPADLNK